MSIQPRDILALIELFEASDWDELHLKLEDVDLFLSTDPQARSASAASLPAHPVPTAAALSAASLPASSGEASSGRASSGGTLFTTHRVLPAEEHILKPMLN